MTFYQVTKYIRGVERDRHVAKNQSASEIHVWLSPTDILVHVVHDTRIITSACRLCLSHIIKTCWSPLSLCMIRPVFILFIFSSFFGLFVLNIWARAFAVIDPERHCRFRAGVQMSVSTHRGVIFTENGLFDIILKYVMAGLCGLTGRHCVRVSLYTHP